MIIILIIDYRVSFSSWSTLETLNNCYCLTSVHFGEKNGGGQGEKWEFQKMWLSISIVIIEFSKQLEPRLTVYKCIFIASNTFSNMLNALHCIDEFIYRSIESVDSTPFIPSLIDIFLSLLEFCNLLSFHCSLKMLTDFLCSFSWWWVCVFVWSVIEN